MEGKEAKAKMKSMAMARSALNLCGELRPVFRHTAFFPVQNYTAGLLRLLKSP